MKNYELVIFDVDGTLLNTSQGIISSVKHAINKYNLNMPTQEQLYTFIGPPLTQSFNKYCNVEGEMLDDVVEAFREQYEKEDIFKAEIYPGMIDVLEDMKKRNIKIAVATYKKDDTAKRITKHFFGEKYTNVINGADVENKLKKSDIIMKCMEECNVTDKDKVIMIGDTNFDENGAKKVGIDFIAVTFGFGYTKEDAKNEDIFYAHTTKDILNYV